MRMRICGVHALYMLSICGAHAVHMRCTCDAHAHAAVCMQCTCYMLYIYSVYAVRKHCVQAVEAPSICSVHAVTEYMQCACSMQQPVHGMHPTGHQLTASGPSCVRLCNGTRLSSAAEWSSSYS